MKKVFISQPICGRTDEEILEERDIAISVIKKKFGDDVEIIDSFFEDFGPDTPPLYYLGKSIELLAYADVAYFCKGWDEKRGCKIENICAHEYDIECIEIY